MEAAAAQLQTIHFWYLGKGLTVYKNQFREEEPEEEDALG